MDIGNAFSYVFEDEDWMKKVGIGGILLIVPFIGWFALSGYMLQTLKNVRDGHERPLPEWGEWGDIIMKGFMMFIIGLVYNIPSILLSCTSTILQIIANPEVGLVDADSGVIAAIGLTAVCISCLQFVVSILFNALLPAAYIRFAQSDSIGSAFQIGAIFSFISSNIGDYIIVILLGWVTGIVGSLGIILCCVGIFFTLTWSTFVNGHLYGQLARKMPANAY